MRLVLFGLLITLLNASCANSPTPMVKQIRPDVAGAPAYTFKIDSMSIQKLRSRVTDTDNLRFDVTVDSEQTNSYMTKGFGDLKVGTVPTDELQLGPVAIPTTASKVTIVYSIVNQGNQGEIDKWGFLQDLNKLLADATKDDHTWYIRLLNIGFTKMNGFWSWIFANCDGVVATYNKELNGTTISAFSGDDTPHKAIQTQGPKGCSEVDSDYKVKYVVSRVR